MKCVETQTFLKELTSLLNKYSKENESNTPDWILADYLQNCLKSFNHAVADRAHSKGRLNP
jgi:hypothetical protein